MKIRQLLQKLLGETNTGK